MTDTRSPAGSAASPPPDTSAPTGAPSPVSPALRALPNILTGLRILAIPPLIAAFLAGPPWSVWLPFLIFAFASVTDWLDGILARRWDAGTKLGQFMDPIADKLLVVAVILMLAGDGTVAGWHLVPAIAILCREMFVSGLREFLAFRHIEMPVSKLAKWKTATQMAALTVLLLPFAEARLPGLVLFWTAGALALQTGWAYLKGAWPHFAEDDPAGSDNTNGEQQA